MNQILFFDCETPNHRNDRISQMGIIVDKDGKEIFRKAFLINPEETFDEFNISLTHITPDMVAGKPTFKDIWPEISGFFNDSLIVAHNARSADLSFLNKVIQHYKIDISVVQYIDTMRSPKGYDGPLTLNDLCQYYGIELNNHHDALADTTACRALFYKMNEESPWTESDQRTYWFHEVSSHAGASVAESSFAELSGIISGISMDKIIDADEILLLKKWLINNENNRECYEFKDLYKTVSILVDNQIMDPDLYAKLSSFLETNSRKRFSNTTHELQVLKGILSGVTADCEISEREATHIKNWMEKHPELYNNYPFSTIFDCLEKVLKKGYFQRRIAKNYTGCSTNLLIH